MAIRKTAGYAWNLISLIGMVLAVTATALIIVFFALEVITGVEHAYLGLMTYFLFPGMLIFGLLLVPFGAWRVRNDLARRLWLRRASAEIPRWLAQIPPYAIGGVAMFWVIERAGSL